jgi:hypothetical protein
LLAAGGQGDELVRACAQARPAKASAMAVSARASGGVRRARREVTRWPPAGTSASRRSHQLCTRPEGLAAPRAHAMTGMDARPQAQQTAGGFHDHPAQVRQQPLQADLMLA